MSAAPAEFTHWLFADYHAQRDALMQGRLRVSELARAQLDWISRWQPTINAFIALDAERAMTAALDADTRFAGGQARPLEGLLVAVKDNIDVAGLVTTAGMATRRDGAPASVDAPMVALLRQAGAIVLGKLNMHEAALGADNDNPHFGACHNPHRHGFTPGGSSGGSGAAVAAGFCTVALGSDSMGSVRIPASYCGVLGLKASFGAFSPRGSVVLSRRLDHLGPLARSTRDLASILEHAVRFDAHSAQSRHITLTAPHGAPLVIGVLPDASLGLDDDVEAAYQQACHAMQALGHQLIELSLGEHDFGRARRAGLLTCEAEMLCEHAADWKASPEKFSPALAGMLHWVESRKASDFVAADRQLDAAMVLAQGWLEQCDVVLTPTAPQCAFSFGEAVPANQADLTSIANMAGLPALSIPMPVATDQLPMGLQLIGAHAGEATLLALADAYLDATRYQPQRPTAMQDD